MGARSVTRAPTSIRYCEQLDVRRSTATTILRDPWTRVEPSRLRFISFDAAAGIHSQVNSAHAGHGRSKRGALIQRATTSIAGDPETLESFFCRGAYAG